MNRRAVTTTLGLVFSAALIGCASKPYSPLSAPALASVSTPTEPPPEVIVLAHEPAAVIGLDNVEVETMPIMTATNAPVTIAPSAMAFGHGWIPLRAWTARCATGSAERSVGSGTTAYRIQTRSGWLKLTVGSRLAQWNGTAVWLGFAPQIVHGEPHIHALDAEKTLLPLVEMPISPHIRTRAVVLDPGHGGSDSGTRGSRGELEKIYALDWALRTERLLTNAGWKVFLTRRTDTDVSLGERVAFADRVRADLFISLHFNSTFPQTQPSGIETYCLTPNGMPSTLARGYADDERAWFPNNAFDTVNLDWAIRIHRSLVAQTHGHDDGIKRARFMGVLRYQNRPAVLVEGGFLSNAHDAANIDTGAYREILARAVADALK